MNARETVGDGRNALHIAAINENEVIVRLLAAAPGFDTEVYSGESRLDKPLLGIWREYANNNNNLLDMARLLLELGADVNAYRTANCGANDMSAPCLKNTLVIAVSYWGHLDWLTELLTITGINVNHFNNEGKTALDHVFLALSGTVYKS